MQPLPPSIPPRPDLAPWPLPSSSWSPPPTTPHRFPRWVIGSAVLTVLFMVAASGVSLITRYDPADHADEYRFLARNFEGDPVRWNPCEPIHYVVNLGLAPEGSLQDVQEAVRRTSLATGIEFVDDGLSDEVPERRRFVYQPDRYGDRWAPVLIAWVDPDDTDIPFARDGHTAAGVAAPLVAPGENDVLVSGWIAINQEDPNPAGFGSIGSQGPVVLHELGHVMGLDHVKSPGQLMEPSGGGVTDFGSGRPGRARTARPRTRVPHHAPDARLKGGAARLRMDRCAGSGGAARTNPRSRSCG